MSFFGGTTEVTRVRDSLGTPVRDDLLCSLILMPSYKDRYGHTMHKDQSRDLSRRSQLARRSLAET